MTNLSHAAPCAATAQYLPAVPARVAFPTSGTRRRGTVVTALATALVTALVAGTTATACAAQAQSTEALPLSVAALDSVRAALRSTDWGDRHAAIARINTAYPDALPSAIVPAILELLAREAVGQQPDDEGYGEYVIDLVLTGVRTGDARAVPAILSLDGLGISSGVAGFVASHGRMVMAALDSLALTREDRASDVVETYALMLARYSSRLTHADSVQVMRRLVAAAGDTSVVVRSQLAFVASRVPLPELLPAVAVLAASDPDQINGVYTARRDAGRALPVLVRARAALPTGELLNRLTLLTDAACDDADGRLQGQCTALAAHLAAAARHLAAGQARPAANALDSYRDAVQRLAADRLLPHLTVVTLDGTARAITDRL